jgi:membrane protein DedA with SNARE-associated domain
MGRFVSWGKGFLPVRRAAAGAAEFDASVYSILLVLSALSLCGIVKSAGWKGGPLWRSVKETLNGEERHG